MESIIVRCDDCNTVRPLQYSRFPQRFEEQVTTRIVQQLFQRWGQSSDPKFVLVAMIILTIFILVQYVECLAEVLMEVCVSHTAKYRGGWIGRVNVSNTGGIVVYGCCGRRGFSLALFRWVRALRYTPEYIVQHCVVGRKHDLQ